MFFKVTSESGLLGCKVRFPKWIQHSNVHRGWDEFISGKNLSCRKAQETVYPQVQDKGITKQNFPIELER